MSDPDVRLGFVALNDSAPLLIAKERGFFRRHGLRVELVRELRARSEDLATWNA